MIKHLSEVATVLAFLLLAGPASASDRIQGQVLGGGAPVARSTVTLWAAGPDAPRQLTQAKTGADGRFDLKASAFPSGAQLYVVATGGKATSDKRSPCSRFWGRSLRPGSPSTS
jgi:hypothetical protein